MLDSLRVNHLNVSWHLGVFWGSSVEGKSEITSEIPTFSTRGPSAKVGLSANFWCNSIQGIYAQFTEGVHLPQYVHLPCFVYWYSRQISSVRVEISYCHLGGVLKACFKGVKGVTSDMTVQC